MLVIFGILGITPLAGVLQLSIITLDTIITFWPAFLWALFFTPLQLVARAASCLAGGVSACVNCKYNNAISDHLMK